MRLLWSALVISMLSGIPGVRHGLWNLENAMLTWIYLATMLTVFAAFGFLFYMTGRGENWARWVGLLMFAVGLISSYSDPDEIFAQGSLAAAVDLLTNLMEILAYILLFQKESSRWFKKALEPETV